MPKQCVQARRRVFGKSKRAFELPVALERSGNRLATPECFPIDPALQPHAMAKHGHGKIAPMENARRHFIPEAIAQMAAPIQCDQSADVAVKIWELVKHRGPIIEVIAIERAAPRSAMGRDHSDAAFERETQ